MRLSKDDKLSVLQSVLGIVLSIAAGVIVTILFAGEGTAEKSDVNIVSGAVTTLAGLIVVIGIDLIKLKSAILSEVHTVEERLSNALTIDREILKDPKQNEIVRRLLAPKEGLEKVRRNFIFKQASGHLNFCRTQFENFGEEYDRIELLADVTKGAQKYVYAYTYASPDYLRLFWQKPEAAIRKYYDAHRVAIQDNRLENVERVFVMPDDMLAGSDQQALEIALGVIHELRKLGMERVYLLGESAAKNLCNRHKVEFPASSFFVSDDVFLSEAEAKEDRSPGYVAFTGQQVCAPFVYKFRMMRGLGDRVTEDYVARLRSSSTGVTISPPDSGTRAKPTPVDQSMNDHRM